jgi:hypothetical protein
MKNFKTKIIALIAVAIIFSTGIVRAGNNEPLKMSDLNVQIYKELAEVLRTPTWLNFKDKNIAGETSVTITIENSGKIVLKSINGESNFLNNMVSHKIESLNLWTDPKFAGSDFTYKIVSK